MRSLLLPDGRVFVFDAQQYGSWPAGQPQIYDPVRNVFVAAPSVGRDPYAAIGLADGRLLLAGSSTVVSDGASENPLSAWITIYDPGTGAMTFLDPPRVGWQEPVLLADGRVLLVGGMKPSASGDGPAPVPFAQILDWSR